MKMSAIKNTNKNQSDKKPQFCKLLKSLFEQKLEGILCDVKLHIQGSNILAHACVLASCSSYFMEHFKSSCISDLNEDSHWCLNKPIIIDLDKVITPCLICVTKIVDFMYLREIVILKGHFKHFCGIVNCLKVGDLLPLCKRLFTDTNSKLFLEDLNLEEEANEKSCGIESDEMVEIDNCSVKGSEHEMKNYDSAIQSEGLSVVPQEVSGESSIEIKTSFKNCGFVDSNEERTRISNLPNLQNNSLPTDFQPENNINNKKLEANARQKCEFICCNSNQNIFTFAREKKQKRRQIMCGKCNFSSISVLKMLKHLEGTDHLGNVCPICVKPGDKIELKQHLKCHFNSKPFMCHICNKRNRFWEYHQLHLKVHCRNKQFNCEVCHKSFKRHQNLTAHLLTHNKSYPCSSCNYFSSNIDTFRLHRLQHEKENPRKDTDVNLADENRDNHSNDPIIRGSIKQFYCQICSERFTQKKNLTRHVRLKHLTLTEYKCSQCSYLTKRTDLIRNHMMKHHNIMPVQAEGKKVKEKNKKVKKEKSEASHGDNDIVGVLIPVNLVSSSDKSTLSAYAVKTRPKERLENTQNEKSGDQNVEFGYVVDNQSKQPPLDQVRPNMSESSRCFFSDPNLKENQLQSTSETELWNKKINSLHSLSSSNDTVKPSSQRKTSESELDHLQVDFAEDISCFERNGEMTMSNINNIYTDPQEFNNLNLVDKENRRNTEDLDEGSKLLDRNEDIWLNESTGELLSGNSFVNLHMIDTLRRGDHSHQVSTAPLDFRDSFQTLILNEATGGLSVFDLGDDPDDFISNPQTPQTNLVEVDDPENLFPWNHLDNSFCSTWVLNEATGELNLVSFGIQPLKNSDGLKLDEITGNLSSVDDDETALFLNEGTGDLSVIYFNPNKSECNTPKPTLEFLNQDILETLSEHSNDDDIDDTLNEEFLRASANFMAHDGNETFLNELTGEFDIAHFREHYDVPEHQVSGNESVYLNEETGEISWNVLDQNLGHDFFANNNILNYDFDDSLNCEDLEAFSTEINGFPSQYRLDSNSSNDWHLVDENCDTLLNECTGEFVKRS